MADSLWWYNWEEACYDYDEDDDPPEPEEEPAVPVKGIAPIVLPPQWVGYANGPLGKPPCPVALGPGTVPRTQKAKGVQALLASIPAVPKPCLLIQKLEDLKHVEFTAKMFARPCPLVPCPGFIESRVIKSLKDLEALWKSVEAVDKDGEILIMPFQTAAWNLCVTPGRLSIGPGHCGATAPTAEHPALDFPLTSTIPPSILELSQAASVAIGEVPHIEVVITEGNMLFWVQIRSGPQVPGGADFIPAAMTVQRIEAPIDDLLAWKDKVAGFSAGTVVHAPGHGLGSHAALHCLGAGVPFITTFKPTMGSVLTPTPTSWDLKAVAEGIGWGIGADLRDGENNSTYRKAALLVLYGLHHSPAFHGESGFWLGAAAGTMLRIGISCGQGEFGGDGQGGHKCPGQGKYQSEVLWNISHLPKFMAAVPEMIDGFFAEGVGDAGRHYGGGVWGRCTYTLIELDRAMRAVLAAQTTGATGPILTTAIGDLIIALNKSVDQAHHGAWWLNRFGVGQPDFAKASEGEWSGVMEVAPYLRKIEVSRAKSDWAKHLPVYLGTAPLGAPQMHVTAQIIAGLLDMVWKYRTFPSVKVPVPPGIANGIPIIIERAMKDTCLTVSFCTQDGLVLHEQEFEFEKEARPQRRLGREERIRTICKTALTEATAT